MADEETSDPGRDFAALMSSAAQAAAPEDTEPKYGWTTDPVTGERRPKKTAGRPRKPPPIEDLKAAKAAEDPAEGARGAQGVAGDRAPSPGKRKKTTPAGDAAVPQHRPGIITKGMNKRYRQLGKMVRGIDRDIGQALITMAENTSDEPDEDTSVGACWDDVARTNPRVRKFCLAVVQGGAMGALVMAHSPLFLAIALKFVSKDPGFFGKMIVSMAEPDEDTPEGEGGLPFGMTAADVAQMMEMAGAAVEQQQAAMTNGTPPSGLPPQRKPPQQFARHGQGKRR